MAAEPILVTGAAGFIGFHVAQRLAASGRPVIGIDNLNAYYDPALKQARLAELARFDTFRFRKLDLKDRDGVAALFAACRFTHVVPLAAQAGAHFATPRRDYCRLNITRFLKVLGLRNMQPSFRVSSSVYGANTAMPFRVSQNVDHPLSLYGASKKANELMAHAYAHLFALPATGLRFFTVYGPWGRPDMAMWLFADAILAGRPIKLFNRGDMKRDFTCRRLRHRRRPLASTIRPRAMRPGRAIPIPPAAARQRICNIGNPPFELMDVCTSWKKRSTRPRSRIHTDATRRVWPPRQRRRIAEGSRLPSARRLRRASAGSSTGSALSPH
jgi:UDP-glucuronate 4-epimerase